MAFSLLPNLRRLRSGAILILIQIVILVIAWGIGRKGDKEWGRWPGFNRPADGARSLDFAAVKNSVYLTSEELAEYVKGVAPVTDNNQLLSYGKEGLHRQDLSKRLLSGEKMAVFLELKKRLNNLPE